MTDLFQALYLYANENRMVYPMEDRLQIRESSRISDRTKESLIARLSKEDQELLESYIKAEETIQLLEQEAVFRAGLSIGLELSRL